MIRITDLADHVSRPSDSVRTILARINASPYLFQVVVNENGRLLGTITDGDMRRAILQGLSLDSMGSACLQAMPKFGRVGQDTDNLRILGSVPRLGQFLPIVDDKGCLCEILVSFPQDSLATALVMAGGPGTRLGERTRSTPKPLLEIGGRPILDRLLETLETAGIRRVIISVHYLADQVEAFAGARNNLASIEFIREPARLGTAGALGLIDPASLGDSLLLVVNGDVVTRVDYRALNDFHARHGNDGTIAVASYQVDVPFGVVRHDANGMFERVDEKPSLQHFVAAGVYCLNAPFLALVPKNKPLDMPDLLSQGKALGLRVGVFPIHEEWADIGQPRDFDLVDASLRRSQS
jgi:dTDP-glucose pyrophosphorylase